jgi:pimeloyl-ACP methyl ester carboxylesterase
MLAALLLGACARDPMDDPYYAAACHGPPVRGVEARSEAMQQGYTINQTFDCISKESWEDVQRANQLVAGLVAQAEREAKASSSPAALPRCLAEAREGFKTVVRAPANGTALPKPPPDLFIRSDYTGGEGRDLAAFVTPDPRDGLRHAAIVWLTGGDSSTLDDFWTPGAPQSDESASAFRKAGLVMMFPTLRGGNTDEGAREFFYGEVDDVHAAANHLARLPYVDPARIYLGGHSTGGTLALLAAETGGRYAAVFAFGPVGSIDRYPASMLNFDLAALSEREQQLRSPRHWLKAISTPTYLIEGMEAPSNIGQLEALCSEPGNESVSCIAAQGFDHFGVIDGVGRVLAARLAADAPVQGKWLTPAEFAAPAR